MATLKEAIEFAKNNPTSTFATTLRQKIESGEADARIKAEGINIPGYTPKTSVYENTLEKLSQRGENIAQEVSGDANMARKVLRTVGQVGGGVGDVIGGGIEAVFKGADRLTGGNISESISAEGNTLLNTGLGKQALSALQAGMENYKEWKTNNPEFAKDLEAVVNIATIVPVVKGAGLVGKATGEVAGSALQGVKTATQATAEAVSPLISGTGEVLKSAGRTLKTIPENIATNVGEMQAKEALIKTIPSSLGQNAVRKGIDVSDVTTLQEAIKTPDAKKLFNTIKNFAGGDKTVSPFEVIGKPIVDRLKTIDSQVKGLATELDTVAQDLKGISLADVSKIDTAIMEGLNKLQIGVKKDGLDFIGSSLEGIGNSGTIVNNVYKRLQTARDAFDLHNLKKYIDANVSYGKRLEGLDSGAERLLKTWRKSIDDTLDGQFVDYNNINTELAKRISPLEDLKSVLKNTDGLDVDLLNEKAGIIARRITSAAASNPEIKQVLRNLDKFSAKGKTLSKIENLQDIYNVLNKYYDIAPKTGFQNLIKEGTGGATGIVEQATEKIQGFVGSTNATRQKALEDYLTELLTKTSKSKK